MAYRDMLHRLILRTLSIETRRATFPLYPFITSYFCSKNVISLSLHGGFSRSNPCRKASCFSSTMLNSASHPTDGPVTLLLFCSNTALSIPTTIKHWYLLLLCGNVWLEKLSILIRVPNRVNHRYLAVHRPPQRSWPRPTLPPFTASLHSWAAGHITRQPGPLDASTVMA